MLQIISNSNETSTGAELVQNGDFSQLGADLVTNGDFSATGADLISNGDFSATGAEMNTLPSQSGSVGNHYRFGYYGTNTIAYDGSGVTTITYVGDPQGGYHYFNDNYNFAPPLATVEGKSYLATITCKVNSGTFSINISPGSGLSYVSVASGISNTDYVTYSAYFVAGTTATSWIRCEDLGTGQVVSINNVSIKELGEDWIPQPIDPDSASFDENGLTLVQSSDLGDNSRIYQPNVTEDDKSYKVTYTIHSVSLASGSSVQYYVGNGYVDLPEQGIGTHTFYYTRQGTSDTWFFNLRVPIDSPTDFVTISSIVVQELGEGWTIPLGWEVGASVINSVSGNASLSQDVSAVDNVNYKVSFNLSAFTSGTLYVDIGSSVAQTEISSGVKTLYFASLGTGLLRFYGGSFIGSITNISVQQLDPNGYWTLGTGWSIGEDKAISTVTGSESDITQSILTAGKTYQTVFEVVDFTAGTVQAVVTGDEGTDRTAIETYTESLTATGTDFSIRSKLGTFDGSVSSVSAKLVGSYSDQSIYVTAADVQTIAQASVYYLVELTSMASKNSLYFLPSSIVANNGRYTKLNFTVVSKDATPTPASGIISFYDSTGGEDTYPMGFYEFKIYEQTSSTNLDPTLATGLLEKGFAFVRDFSGNMQELTDGFNEYDPTLTQYVYSK